MFLGRASCSSGTLYGCDLLLYGCRPRTTILQLVAVRASPLAHSARGSSLLCSQLRFQFSLCIAISQRRAYSFRRPFPAVRVVKYRAAQPSTPSGAAAKSASPLTANPYPFRGLGSGILSAQIQPTPLSGFQQRLAPARKHFRPVGQNARCRRFFYSIFYADYASLPRIQTCTSISHLRLPRRHGLARLNPLRHCRQGPRSTQRSWQTLWCDNSRTLFRLSSRPGNIQSRARIACCPLTIH